jgi:hypothetical protein
LLLTIGEHLASAPFLRLPAEISAQIHSHTLNDAVMRSPEKQPCLDLFLDAQLSKLPQKILLFFRPRRSIGIHA